MLYLIKSLSGKGLKATKGILYVELYEGIEIVGSYPALWIESIDAIVISDLHLGYEHIALEDGFLVPTVQLRESIATMRGILGARKSSNIILCGDVKHEFSETSYHEYREVSDFIDFLKGIFARVIVIKGNHDTFISRVTGKKGVELYDSYSEKNFRFIHGDKAIDVDGMEEEFLIMGHEHPSIVMTDALGRKEKVKAFLYGEHRGKKVIVMPAFSYFAQGSDINSVPREKLLSPMLRSLDTDSFRAVGITDDGLLLPFPEMGRMRV